MKTSSKKAQSAMEFLAAYSWVILVAAIGLTIVWRMDLLRLPATERGMSGFSQVYVTDFSTSTNSNELYLSIRSDASVPVTIYAGGVNASMLGVYCYVGPSSDIEMSPGNQTIITLDCSGPPSMDNAYDPRDYFEAYILIEYSNKISGRQHYSIGKVYGPVEGS